MAGDDRCLDRGCRCGDSVSAFDDHNLEVCSLPSALHISPSAHSVSASDSPSLCHVSQDTLSCCEGCIFKVDIKYSLIPPPDRRSRFLDTQRELLYLDCIFPRFFAIFPSGAMAPLGRGICGIHGGRYARKHCRITASLARQKSSQRHETTAPSPVHCEV